MSRKIGMLFFTITCLSVSVFAQFDSVVPAAAIDIQPELGTGYDTSHQAFRGPCATSKQVKYAGNASSSLTFSRSLSQREVSDSLGFAIGGGARFGIVKASAAAEFARSSSSNDYSESAIYRATYRFKNAKLDYNGLMPEAQLMLKRGPEYFSEQCGDHYVSDIQLGAELYISAKVEFASRASKQMFSSRFSISGPLWQVQGQLESASKEFGRSMSVSISAYQIGGRISQISQIFDVPGRVVGSLHPLLTCSGENIAMCTAVLSAAIDYATSLMNQNSFPNQLKDGRYDAQSPDGPAHLAYVTSPWTNLGFTAKPQILTLAVNAARKNLADRFEAELVIKNRVEGFLLGRIIRLSPPQRTAIDAIHEASNFNIDAIYRAAKKCYESFDECPEVAQDTLRTLKTIDATQLEVLPETLAQWCDIRNLPATLKSSKKTMDALVELSANKVNDFKQVVDQCALVDRLVNSEERLDLVGRHLTDLTPLTTLSRSLIREIRLQGNEPHDLSPLSSLQGLKYLYLDQELIKDPWCMARPQVCIATAYRRESKTVSMRQPVRIQLFPGHFCQLVKIEGRWSAWSSGDNNFTECAVYPGGLTVDNVRSSATSDFDNPYTDNRGECTYTFDCWQNPITMTPPH